MWPNLPIIPENLDLLILISSREIKIVLSVKVSLIVSVFAIRDIYINSCTLVYTGILKNIILQFIIPHYF